MILEQERKDMLTQAAQHREREVMHHQINIDNYGLAITEIETNHADNVDLQAFAHQLRELLASSVVEQAKEAVMLKVIKAQLE